MWVASWAHFMAFRLVVGFDIWARLFPCHLVEKAMPSEPNILSHSCGEWYCVNDVA